MYSISDFEQPFFGLTRQGTTANPKGARLFVIAWEPRGKGEPPLSAVDTRTNALRRAQLARQVVR